MVGMGAHVMEEMDGGCVGQQTDCNYEYKPWLAAATTLVWRLLQPYILLHSVAVLSPTLFHTSSSCT